MIGIVNPLQALEFIVLFLVLQQIEGNLIYPHVVGNFSWSSFYYGYLSLVIIGGNLMGYIRNVLIYSTYIYSLYFI